MAFLCDPRRCKGSFKDKTLCAVSTFAYLGVLGALVISGLVIAHNAGCLEMNMENLGQLGESLATVGGAATMPVLMFVPVGVAAVGGLISICGTEGNGSRPVKMGCLLLGLLALVFTPTFYSQVLHVSTTSGQDAVATAVQTMGLGGALGTYAFWGGGLPKQTFDDDILADIMDSQTSSRWNADWMSGEIEPHSPRPGTGEDSHTDIPNFHELSHTWNPDGEDEGEGEQPAGQPQPRPEYESLRPLINADALPESLTNINKTTSAGHFIGYRRRLASPMRRLMEEINAAA